jgi:hypothetical protein
MRRLWSTAESARSLQREKPTTQTSISDLVDSCRRDLARGIRVILEVMTTPGRPRRHLSSSPFGREPEPVIEEYAVDDLVSHDAYGVGRVLQADAAAVIVDFGSQTVRVPRPFAKMSKL